MQLLFNRRDFTSLLHLICHDLIILMSVNSQNKLWIPSACGFLQSPVTSSLLGPGERTLFISSFLKNKNHISTKAYKPSDKLHVTFHASLKRIKVGTRYRCLSSEKSCKRSWQLSQKSVPLLFPICTSIFSIASRRLSAMQSQCSGSALHIEAIPNTKTDEV